MGLKKQVVVPTTARVVWNIRTPPVAELERVLQDMSDAGWLLYKHSEPIKGKSGVYFVLTYHKAELVTGDEAQKLMTARKTGA